MAKLAVVSTDGHAGPRVEAPAALVTEFEKRGGFLKDAPPLVPDRLDAIMDESMTSSTGA